MKQSIAKNTPYIQIFTHIGIQKKQYSKKTNRISNGILNIATRTLEHFENINTAIYTQKKYMNLINSILSKGGYILIDLKQNIECFNSFVNNKNTRNTNCILLLNWINGILTNKRAIVTKATCIFEKYFESKLDRDISFYMYSEIKKMIYLPQLILLTNTNTSAVHEGTLLNIPCMIIQGNQKDPKMLYSIQGTQSIIWNTYMYTSFVFAISERVFYKRYKNV